MIFKLLMPIKIYIENLIQFYYLIQSSTFTYNLDNNNNNNLYVQMILGSDLVDWLISRVGGFADRRDAKKYACRILKGLISQNLLNNLLNNLLS